MSSDLHSAIWQFCDHLSSLHLQALLQYLTVVMFCLHTQHVPLCAWHGKSMSLAAQEQLRMCTQSAASTGLQSSVRWLYQQALWRPGLPLARLLPGLLLSFLTQLQSAVLLTPACQQVTSAWRPVHFRGCRVVRASADISVQAHAAMLPWLCTLECPCMRW